MVSSGQEIREIIPVDSRFDDVRGKIEAMVEREEIPSMSIAVAHRGEIIWLEGLGWADREQQIEATPNTVYPVGSLSKSMMATGVLTLIEQDLIELDDPVADWIAPEKLIIRKEGGDEVRLWHLLNMSAGIPHGWAILTQAAEKPLNREEKNAFLEHIGQVVFPPGELYHYSNNSMGLAEWVIEGRTGRDFAEYMESEFFEPLGMHHSGVRIEDDFRNAVARRYNASLEPIDEPQYTVAAGGLGFYSSVYDLIRYGMFHLNTRLPDQESILSDALLDEMHYFDKGPDTLFALGWFTGDRLISNGSIGGANAHLTLVPSEELAIACATNMTSPISIADQICGEITELFVTGVVEAGRQNYERYMQVYRAPYTPRPALRGQWKGTMISSEGPMSFELRFDESGGILAQLDDQEATSLDNVTVNPFSFLRGRFLGVLPTYRSEVGNTQHIQLYLHLDGESLTGYASSPFRSSMGSFNVPVFVELRKESNSGD